MANKTLNTRIKLRYASYAEWMSSTVKLLAGEVAVCYVESNNEEVKNTAPTVLFKVGDGTHTFSELQWASARAADVYDWAKTSSRPVYTKADVGLGNVANVESYAKTETYSQSEVNTLISNLQNSLEADTNTKYQIVANGTNSFKLQSKEIGGEWTDVADSVFSVDFEAISNIIATKANAADVYTKAEADGKFLTSHQDISGKADKTYVDEELAKKANTSYVNDELAKKVDKTTYEARVSTVDGQLSTINGAIEDINEEIGLIDADIEEIEGNISSINGTLGGKAEKSYVDEQLALKADKTTLDSYYTKDQVDSTVDALDGRITANANAIELLTEGAGTDEIDSVKELIDYVNEHGTEVTGLKADIKANADAIDAVEGRLDVVEAKPAMGITSDNIGAWTDAAGKAHVHENKAVLDGISTEKVAAWDAAEKNAKDYADGLNNTLSGTVNGIATRVGNIEADYLKKADKEALEGAIATEKGRIDEIINTTIPGLDDRIDALESKPFGTYATKAELEEVEGAVEGVSSRVSTIEGDYLKSSDKTTLENAIANAEKSAKDYADGLNTTMDGRVDTIEANYLSVLDTIIWDCGGANE